MKTRKLIKHNNSNFHNEVLKIANRLFKRYSKRLTPLKRKGFKKQEIRKIYSDSVLELRKMVDRIKL